MNTKNIKLLTVNLPEKIKNILNKINKNSLGIIFVVDNQNRLVGSITDGDIRRKLLDGFQLSNPISEIYNKKFISADINIQREALIKKLRRFLK